MKTRWPLWGMLGLCLSGCAGSLRTTKQVQRLSQAQSLAQEALTSLCANPQKARAAMSQAESLAPHLAQVRAAEGVLADWSGQYAAAAQAYSEALAAADLPAPSRSRLLVYAAQLGEAWPAGQASLEQLLRSQLGSEMPPDEGIKRAALALLLARSGRAEAYSEALAALLLDEQSATARLALAVHFHSQQQPALAHFALDSALALQPNNLLLLGEKARLHWQQGEFAPSLRTLEAALRLCPGHPQLRNNLAVLQSQAGAQDKALAELQEASFFLDKHPLLHLNRGNALFLAQKNSEAQAAYSQALALGSSQAAYNLALLALAGSVNADGERLPPEPAQLAQAGSYLDMYEKALPADAKAAQAEVARLRGQIAGQAASAQSAPRIFIKGKKKRLLVPRKAQGKDRKGAGS